MTEFPAEKIAALHAHLRLRGGKMTTASIGRAVLAEVMSPHTEGELQKLLEREADRLGIEPVSVPGDGLYWRRKEQTELQPVASTSTEPDKPKWSLDGTIMQTALLVSRELGADGVRTGRDGLPTTKLVKELSHRLGMEITAKAFAPNTNKMGGKWRQKLEEAYQSGRQEYLAKAESVKSSKAAGEDPDAAPSILAPTGPLPEPEELAVVPDLGPVMTAQDIQEAILELRDIVGESVSHNGNGNGHHEEPTDDDLGLVEEVASLESELEEAKREIEALQRRDEEAMRLEQRLREAQDRIALLEALEAASKAAEVSTHQPDPSGTLESLLGTLEAQLEQAQQEQAEAAIKAAAISEKLAAARQLVQVLEG